VDSNNTQEVEEIQEKISFFEGMRQEIKKISWPTKLEISQSTKVVIGSTFFLGFSVYLVDLFVKGVLDSTARIIKVLFQ
jgi:preprotein translocase SecE subunit